MARLSSTRPAFSRMAYLSPTRSDRRSAQLGLRSIPCCKYLAASEIHSWGALLRPPAKGLIRLAPGAPNSATRASRNARYGIAKSAGWLLSAGQLENPAPSWQIGRAQV